MHFARSWGVKVADVVGLGKTIMQSCMKFRLVAERNKKIGKVFQ